MSTSSTVAPIAEGEPERPDGTSPSAPLASGPASLGTVLRKGALVSLLMAVVDTLVLEVSTLWGGEPKWLWDQFGGGGIGFYVDAAVIWLVVLFLWALLGRLWWSIGLVSALVLVVAAANRTKITLREEPVYPSDLDFLSEPEFLGSMVSPFAAVPIVIVMAAVLAGSVAQGRRLARQYPRPALTRLPRRQAVGVAALRVGVLLVSATLLFQTTKFNEPGNLWRNVYEARGEHWRYWNQKTNYRSNGFLGGFLYNMPISAMAEPAGYDQATMDRLARRYERVAARINKDRAGTLADVNVVLVLSESFSDPTQLEGFDLERDPIPQTRAIMAETASGTMLAQMYGGGTANMEFETLTGQSLALFRPQMVSPYQMLVSDYSSYPSAVGWFRDQGHRPVAIHPYQVGMYKREQVYDTLGFEEFVHDTTMQSRDTIDDNPYIDDTAAFGEVLHQIEDNKDPLLVNLVTMQNHIPVEDIYDDPIGVSGIDGGQADRIGQYSRGLEHTDAALAEFLDTLESGDEETIVLFYGDHLPGIYGSDVKGVNGDGLGLHETPFFIWSSNGNRRQLLPVTSPAFFLPLVHRVADAPVPPYLALLDRLHQRVTALQQGRVVASDGAQIPAAELDPRSAKVLDDMRLAQFDFSIGERYAVDAMWPGAAD